jgi:DNA processing protein
LWGVTQLRGWGLVKVRQALSDGVELDDLLLRHKHLLPFPLSELDQRWLRMEAATKSVGGQVVCMDDPNYPLNLCQLVDAPPILHVKGQISAWQKPMIAVVGTRKCTDYAARWAYRLGAQIAESGGTVVSGLAMGVDIAAMRGALDAGGSVIACLGHGLEKIYPVGHRKWANGMLAEGAWISEYPVASRVDRWCFAQRNRIVAGMAERTVLVQSPQRGGGMITAELAADYHRDVLILNPKDEAAIWQGNRAWIDQGALAIQEVTEVPIAAHSSPMNAPKKHLPPAPILELWKALQGSGGCSVKTLSMEVNLVPSRVRSQLMVLELGGWVRRSPGGWFVPLDVSSL